MVANDVTKSGRLAGKKVTFGEFSRYAVAPVHTRFGAVSWFVWDSEAIDDITGCPLVIRQAETKDQALQGF